MNLVVPAVLGFVAILVMTIVSRLRRRKRRNSGEQNSAGAEEVPVLIHDINDDRCTGCDACVAVCPTNVLDLISNKSRVIRFQDCIQCEACAWACPTQALVMHLEGTKPPAILSPKIDENYQTEVLGQYLIGEAAGKPLVKNAANIGRGVIEHMIRDGLKAGVPRRRAEGSDAKEVDTVDVAIVGSGPGGLSAALSCIHRGLSYVVLEKNQVIASTVAHYPKGKLVMAEPYDCPNLSLLPVFDSSKEILLPLWQQLLKHAQVRVQMGESVEEIHKRGSGVFDVRTNVNSYRAQRVVLATGTRGKPRTLGVPGENLPKVSSLLDDPRDYRGRHVLVVGGGDSALEAALALSDAGAAVMLSYRGRQFSRAMAKNRKAIESYAAQKKITIVFESQVTYFDEQSVGIMTKKGEHRFRNSAAFVLIGANPPIEWLGRLGVHFEERPHSYNAPRSDAFVAKFLGKNAVVCPETVEATLPLILGHKGKSIVAHTARPVSHPAPIPLSEFAKTSHRRHHGQGRRDELPPRERTRILRMLRDEGGRLADEDSRMIDLNFVYDPDTKPPEIFTEYAATSLPVATTPAKTVSGAHPVRRKTPPKPPPSTKPASTLGVAAHVVPRTTPHKPPPGKAPSRTIGSPHVIPRSPKPSPPQSRPSKSIGQPAGQSSPSSEPRAKTISDIEWDLE